MEKDVVSGAFFSDNERYADIINGIGCNGISFVKGKDLHQTETKALFGRRRGPGRWRKGTTAKYRDLMRKTAFGMNFAMIGIENQEEIDYALALRVMCYDAGEYERQAAEIRRQVRRNSKGLSSGEYMYGFRKDSYLFPTTTFVLYYGEEVWDGARDLHGLLDFSGIPAELREKVSNYRLHIVEVRRLENTDMFKTDVKQVFDFIRFSGDKYKIRELLDKEQAYRLLDEEAYDMVAAYVGEEEAMLKWKEKYKKGGKVDMCQGIREWLADERMEGRIEGKAEGVLEGKAQESQRMGRLIVTLTEQARLDDLVKAAEDAEHREKMYKELGI